VRLTQGAFSYLPDLTDEQIKKQVQYCIKKGWAVNIECTDDPHPRNIYWELWGLPLFDIKDAAVIMFEIDECRKANTTGYIKVQAFDASKRRGHRAPLARGFDGPVLGAGGRDLQEVAAASQGVSLENHRDVTHAASCGAGTAAAASWRR